MDRVIEVTCKKTVTPREVALMVLTMENAGGRDPCEITTARRRYFQVIVAEEREHGLCMMVAIYTLGAPNVYPFAASCRVRSTDRIFSSSE